MALEGFDAFEREMDETERDIAREWREYVTSIIIILDERIVFRSPVDTGRFRANNFISLGDISDAYFEDRMQQADELATLVTMRDYQDVHYQNNTPYGPFLEEGSSSQAPAGVYAVTVEELKDLFDVEEI